MAIAMLTIYKQNPLWCFPVLSAKEDCPRHACPKTGQAAKLQRASLSAQRRGSHAGLISPDC